MAQTDFPHNGITRRDFLKLIGGGIGLAASGGLLAACTAPASPTAAPTVAAPTAAAVPTVAKASGTLSVYSALNESTNNAFVAAFKASNPGVDVQVLPLAAAGELQTRIQTEKNSPKGDIFVGGSSEFHDPLGKQGLLEAYKSPNAGNVDAAFKEANGLWTGWYIGIFGLVINSDRFAKEMAGVKKPASWDDLLDPVWKGKLAYPDPVKTGGGYIFIATQVFRFNKDEDKAMSNLEMALAKDRAELARQRTELQRQQADFAREIETASRDPQLHERLASLHRRQQDNGAGYYNYDKFQLSEQIRYQGGWGEVTLQARLGYYDYSVQTIAAADARRRNKTNVIINFRGEKKLTRWLKWYIDLEYERSLGNVSWDNYLVNTASSGLSVEF